MIIKVGENICPLLEDKLIFNSQEDLNNYCKKNNIKEYQINPEDSCSMCKYFKDAYWVTKNCFKINCKLEKIQAILK